MTTISLSRVERCVTGAHQLEHQDRDGTEHARFVELTSPDHATPAGFTVEVVVLRTERINNTSRSGNPRFRFHTESGIYTTADDIQQNASLTGDETGAAEFRIDHNRVVAWSFTEQRT